MTSNEKVGYRLSLWLFILMLHIAHSVNVKVAVYEHVVISHPKANESLTREEAFEFMKNNLNIIQERAAEASTQGARIVIFPEYGITGFDHTRSSMRPFLEDIPDGSLVWNPCEDPGRFNDTQVLKFLSCTAKMSSIYIVANMGDIKPCSKVKDPSCPLDGRYQFNTNVVFDDNGRLIARYHKRNMYDETPLFDPAPKNEFVFFDTDFGRFGTVVCFDLLHESPTQNLIEQCGIRNLLVTSAWNVFYPFILPVQMYAGISKRNNITIAVSNARNSKYAMAGSGIFGNGVDASTSMDYENSEGQLLVRELDTFTARNTTVIPEELPLQEFGGIAAKDLAKYVNSSFIGKYFFGMPMSFVPLTGDQGRAYTCYEKACCAVQYDFNVKVEKELFVLSATDFYMHDPGEIHMQFCAVHICASNEPASCGESVDHASSTFSYVKINGFFDPGVVFPFVSTSSVGQYHTMELNKYKFSRSKAIIESDEFDAPMLAMVVFNSVNADSEVSKAEQSLTPKSLTCMYISIVIMCHHVYLIGI
ncbi:vascular non-inflammatory molecule 3-like [Dreissena polymorpha]|uniref:CN hydrolase domain-containing protein n=1 Tax=Dreissena polymorpha TaxID=45954 RepID=A0A9D4MVA2_DREPO|nr:vascular non-inflammatory molecule 3-like [Dreissena polymorpha]KAH3882536.1 hypothetical protein DPMN_006477 [Dreissena polymorpha]